MKKITIPAFREKKKYGQKVTMITVYDCIFARLVGPPRPRLILWGTPCG
jgi:ketopantoate hydroxymethyltransferase